jgi:hypothetical protein
MPVPVRSPSAAVKWCNANSFTAGPHGQVAYATSAVPRPRKNGGGVLSSASKSKPGGRLDGRASELETARDDGSDGRPDATKQFRTAINVVTPKYDATLGAFVSAMARKPAVAGTAESPSTLAINASGNHIRIGQPTDG